MPKNLKEDPLGLVNNQSVAKYKKMEGDSRKFSKKSQSQKGGSFSTEKWKGDPSALECL